MGELHIYNDDIESDIKFLVYESNDSVYGELEDLYYVYKRLTSDSRDPLLGKLRKEDVCLDYNTKTKEGKLTVKYIDGNKHSHTFDVTVRPQRSLHLSIYYIFQASFEGECNNVRSFAELLMFQLWKMGYEAKICKCDRGLIIDISFYQLLSFLEIIRTTIELERPIEWFYDKSPLFDFPDTFYILSETLPKLREEAKSDRWKGVNPENFTFHVKEGYTMIRLDYGEEDLYQMHFKVGYEKDNGCDLTYEDYIFCSYEFINLAKDEEVREYYTLQNHEYCKLINPILSKVFNWEATCIDSEDSVNISVASNLAFQRFCLMLDIALSLLYDFSATHKLITSSMLQLKSEIESKLRSECEILVEDSDLKIFSHGNFGVDPEFDKYLKFDLDMICEIDDLF